MNKQWERFCKNIVVDFILVITIQKYNNRWFIPSEVTVECYNNGCINFCHKWIVIIISWLKLKKGFNDRIPLNTQSSDCLNFVGEIKVSAPMIYGSHMLRINTGAKISIN